MQNKLIYLPYAVFLIVVLLLSGACSRTASINNGKEAYYAKQYAKATQMLQREYLETKKRKDKAILAFFIGESYQKIKQPEVAGRWYFKAYKQGFGDQALVRYARSLIRQERYKEALEIFQRIQEQSKNNYAFDRQILQAKYGEFVKKNYVDSLYLIQAIRNSEYNEYGSFLLKDGNMLFTSDRPVGRKAKIYHWTGKPYTNIFIAPVSAESGASPDLWIPIVRSKDNDGTPVLSPSGKRLVYTSCFSEVSGEDATCKLITATQQDNIWSTPEILPFIDSRYNYTTPAWSADGHMLYFSSDKPGGQGGYDLYRVTFDGENWGVPESLSKRINTSYDELYPVFDRDTLYFSSEGHGGMGGLDIFTTWLKSMNKWAAPKNMGYPFNTGGDEICAVRDSAITSNNVIRAFFISTTGRGKNTGFDIYHISQLKASPAVKKPNPKFETKLYLAIRTLRPSDKGSGKVSPLAKVAIKLLDSIYLTDRKGRLILPIRADEKLEFLLSKKGYFTRLESFNVPDSTVYKDESSYTFQKQIIMKPIVRNKEIVLKDIHYDFDKWDIREDARPTLDSLYGLLLINPKLHIELAAHTDCRGEKAYNLRLSRKRAESVVRYLISKGISPERLRAKGYGEAAPLIDCHCEQCTDAQRQKNRRTSFKVLKE